MKNRTVESFSPDPYIISCVNCACWVMYAIVTPDRLSPLITNAIGLIVNACYTLVFAVNGPPGNFANKVALCTTLTVGVAMIAFFVAPANRNIFGISDSKTSSEISSDVLGTTADIFNILMYGGPLTIMSTVIKSKSVEYMPLLLTLGTSFCSFTWLCYGFVTGDWFILIPNGGGALLCICQIILYCTYCGTDESKRAFSKSKTSAKDSDDEPFLEQHAKV